MEIAVIGLKTEKTGNEFDDKNGMIVQEVVPVEKRVERESYYRNDCDYHSNVRIRTFEVEEPKKWFLMTKEHDAYEWDVLSWGFDKETLEASLESLEKQYPGKYVLVNEDDFFGRLTEEV